MNTTLWSKTTISKSLNFGGNDLQLHLMAVLLAVFMTVLVVIAICGDSINVIVNNWVRWFTVASIDECSNTKSCQFH